MFNQKNMVRRVNSDNSMAAESALNSYHDNCSMFSTEKITVVKAVHDPICSGFLSAFCESQYCAENIRFIIEIDRFRDYFSLDPKSWHTKEWREIDKELGSSKFNSSDTAATINSETQDIDEKSIFIISEDTWPSTKVERKVVQEWIQKIWTEFFGEASFNQICVSSKVKESTMLRIKNIHIYGAEVFQEALIDPVKTVHRDIYPRFLHSDQFRLMSLSLHRLEKLPCAPAFRTSSPENTIYSRYNPMEIQSGSVDFTLDDVLSDKTLYNSFLRYLSHIVSAENLLCYQAIQNFKRKISSPDKLKQARAYDAAWTIYTFFIAVGSSFEISLPPHKKREVMRELATPKVGMFEFVEYTCLSVLKVHYVEFRKTKEFSHLHETLINTLKSGKNGVIIDSKAKRCFGIL